MKIIQVKDNQSVPMNLFLFLKERGIFRTRATLQAPRWREHLDYNTGTYLPVFQLTGCTVSVKEFLRGRFLTGGSIQILLQNDTAWWDLQ